MFNEGVDMRKPYMIEVMEGEEGCQPFLRLCERVKGVCHVQGDEGGGGLRGVSHFQGDVRR